MITFKRNTNIFILLDFWKLANSLAKSRLEFVGVNLFFNLRYLEQFNCRVSKQLVSPTDRDIHVCKYV